MRVKQFKIQFRGKHQRQGTFTVEYPSKSQISLSKKQNKNRNKKMMQA